MKKLTIGSIQKRKDALPLVMITAYDALFARLFSESADILLVGDSLNMSFGGNSDTLSATMDQMIYHTNAVCKGAPETFIITDMPFGSYTDEATALTNAIRVYRETSADAIKIEGGAEKAHLVKHLSDNGFAVCGHIGLLPQAVRAEGGYKVKGKNEHEALSLIADAQAIQQAGAFIIVIEGVKADVATRVAQSVSIPVIGIGAGNGVDGQVLVFSDMLGLYEPFVPKFVKQYMDGASGVKKAVAAYASEVQERSFPDENYVY
ncbi:MAG: 3-methyl-2-oxobutanoate hydroxymethyltransferase [Sulfuricurvum sp. GWF2_44_89]|uniref:3-methyl-2-oxobutanoate hydroxymethyltransferase n=1 Tax=Sulfuricurvum kujiense TaxID=148813 RepID=A0A2D3WNJ8_9BACT|nr:MULTISPECIES: 3-methyl-2-oxobutanoate hydroxymethyltransferase [Sulfuricurvum]OHD79439.1 MAG: 3-methyl-2-oxobutanoate hydroxymethyltransferase [Sulfuricurvum sp. GWF2_44_89]OHD92020.1 MAG: 3-methyl-2-oxobutanoate hydroxymethyltransferase [Sulfuricurvum sp. RIFOXYD12_FULL_44_77]OHD93247.1 MAG: 3-methyl-2-oxobutanoate hydroxymethyltransferase [Sulfuricurvum sp. RIFOXYD2_FULL_44_160]DAB39334.1 MAG TPA: 3-methyl-2-oxobutanoate hydroxymethyltransferase [Sulfuricurvum kujiense]